VTRPTLKPGQINRDVVTGVCGHRCAGWPNILRGSVPSVICDICQEGGSSGTWVAIRPDPVQLTIDDDIDQDI
jgi:hypothetical protein